MLESWESYIVTVGQLGVFDFHEYFNIPIILQQVIIAVAIGGLIGLEREIGEADSSEKFAGLRTLALLCGAGPVMVYYTDLVEYPVLVSLYLALGVTLALGIGYVRFKLIGEEVGFTTSVTVFIVTLLGILVGYEQYFEAVSVGLITAFILAEKEMLTSYVDSLRYERSYLFCILYSLRNQ